MRILFFTTLILLSCKYSTAQEQLMKNSFSNYGGYFAAQNNPARAAKSAHVFHANGGSYGFEINNNYISLGAPFSAWDFLRQSVPKEYKDADGKIKWQDGWLKENLDGELKFGQLNSVVQGPSFLFSYNKWGFAIGTANHTSLRIFNVAEPLARLVRLNNYSALALVDSNGLGIIDNSFSIVANSHQEVSTSFGYVAIDQEKLKLKLGVGFRYLFGLGYGEFHNDGMNMRFYDQDSLVLNNANFSAAYSNPEVFNNFTNDFFNINVAGHGYALNFGASVEWTPDMFTIVTKPERYKFKFGVVLSNVGAMTYDKEITQMSATLNHRLVLNLRDSALVANFASSNSDGIAFLDSLVRQNMTVTNTQGSLNVILPYNLQFDFDWNVYRNFYLGVIPNIAINNSNNLSLKNFSSYILLPRFESKFVEVSIPLIYTQGIEKFQMGALIRLGPLFFGTNDIGFLTRSQSISDVGFYFGISAGLLRKAKTPTDNG